jgi:hypothetical protein
MEASEEALLSHLVASRLAGRVATSAAGSLTNCARLVDGDLDCTFGLSDWKDATYEEVVAAVQALGGTALSADEPGDAGDGFIDPEATLRSISTHGRMLGDFVAGGGGRVVIATGHPGTLTAHYGTLAGALLGAGCHILRPLEDEGAPITYMDGVAALTLDGGRRHTHRPDLMQDMLERLGGADGVDLVLADHGFAGAAIEAGIRTLSIADVNDPALPLAQARDRTSGVLLIDDGLDPSVFVPVTEAMLGWTYRQGGR